MIRRESGAALVEVLTLGLVLLIPLVWMLTVAADLHRGALAASAAAREAGEEVSKVTDPRRAREVMSDAVARAFLDHGLDPRDASVSWRSSPLRRGAEVDVRVGYPVTVLQAPFIGRTAGPSVWIRARHVARVDPYASRDV